MSDRTDKAAVPFRLPDVDGVEHSLEQFQSSWLLMVFHRHLG